MDNYSSPVPFVGLYTAAANWICFLLIISDVLAGFRRSKLWFPCHFFSLNSITLTLMSVATKIPVDLTSAMPRGVDQLSKLTGTVFVCLAMGVMLPSIISQREFESYANVTALSIFVITVAVNISIQISTGLIFSFLIEHCIVLCCMFLLLVRFWLLVVDVNARKAVYTDRNKNLVRNDEQSMLQYLQVCYLHGYNSFPQLLLGKDHYLDLSVMLSLVCFVVLLEAAARSNRSIKFREEASDYAGSMWQIVSIQILTIVVASCTVPSRQGMRREYITSESEVYFETDAYLQFLHLFSFKNLTRLAEVIFRFIVYKPLKMVDQFLTSLIGVRTWMHKWNELPAWMTQPLNPLFSWMEYSYNFDANNEFRDLINVHDIKMTDWVLAKGIEDMKSWMEINKKDPPIYLIKLLSLIPPSTTAAFVNSTNQFSCLSILLLVETAKILTPASETKALTNVLDDVFELVHFIDNCINDGSPRHKLTSIYARVFWKFGLVGEPYYKGWVQRSRKQINGAQLRSEVSILDEFPMAFREGFVRDEAYKIVNLVNLHYFGFESTKEVYDHIVGLFVDMLRFFLGHLPNVLISHIRDSPIEEYEDRARLVLGYYCRFECVVASQGSTNRVIQDDVAAPTVPAIQDDGEIQAFE